jgi:predicted dehydrogenase
MHRRDFLRRSSAASGAVAVATILPGRVWAAEESPNEKLDIAVIGVAGRGAANLGGVSSQNIVALCDVDSKNLAGAAQRYPEAKTFADFRHMLPAVEKQIDAVVVSTPDHTHAPAAAMAMRMGKHCYCEKPLTHNVLEARTLADLAREHKLVTQIGTQIHAGDNYRRVVELVQGGAIGKIDEVHVWSGARYSPGDVPTDTPAVPPNLNWDLWLGPAAERPYHPCFVPFRWRGWWDFGNGGLGDFFCHYSDLAFWALDLKYPTSVAAEGSQPVHPESCHEWMTVEYEFPARGSRPPVKLTWYDGGKRPPQQKELGLPDWGSGVLFMGEKGMILANYGNHLLLPEEKFKDFERPEPTIPSSIGHHKEWYQACKTGGPTTCHFGYSGPLTEAALLGSVSYRSGEPFAWDAANLKPSSAKAESFIGRDYREGWVL